MTQKKRILFVDDEPMVLRGLQRSLSSMRKEWDMEFVESGARALECMSERVFDVLVADMMMPNLSGAELADEVMKSYPKTVRIILSGHTDQEQAIRCVKSTHQFLSKPCEIERLKSTVGRALAFGVAFDNDELRSVMGKIQVLPSLPSLYLKLVEMLAGVKAGVNEIALTVRKDVGMTAKILQIANSAYFGFHKPTSNIGDAISCLGMEVLKSLVLTLHVFSELEKMKTGGISVEVFWTQSYKIGGVAKAIAQREGKSLELCEQAFVGGMLHGLGKIIMASNFKGVYSDLLKTTSTEQLQAERDLFKTTHAEVGGYLLGLWGLPLPIVEAVMRYPTPHGSPTKEFCPLTAVHVAHALVMNQSQELSENAPTWKTDMLYLQNVGCEARFEDWVLFLKNHPLFQ
jgi:HD-like signal output (HDOD) protein/CheY-like chemotaxis protein